MTFDEKNPAKVQTFAGFFIFTQYRLIILLNSNIKAKHRKSLFKYLFLNNLTIILISVMKA